MSMDSSSVSNAIMEMVQNRTEKSLEEIKSSETLSDAGVDSLDMFELIFEIEEHFQIEIEDSDIEDMGDFADVIRCVEAKIAN